MEISPSLLSADFGNLNQEIQTIATAGSSRLHLDVIDGVFAPNLSFGIAMLEKLVFPPSLALDLHLMIQAPEISLARYLTLPVTTVCLHIESTIHIHRHLKTIQQANKQAGIALNPSTSLTSLDWLLEELDLVLIMSVNPGFSGQQFIPFSLQKIEDLANRISKINGKTKIMVDGGVNTSNIKQIQAAGASICVAGAAVFGQKDYKQAFINLQQATR